MAAVSNFFIDQGADFSTTLSLTDSNGDILNLTGYTALGQMRKTYGSSTIAATFTLALTAATGQNPARQAAMAADVPVEVPSFGINQLCGSGLKTIVLALQSIKNNDASIVVAGGQESMSQAPHCIHLRDGKRMGDTKMVDTMLRDGLWDAFNGYHMGCTAENIAKQWQIGEMIKVKNLSQVLKDLLYKKPKKKSQKKLEKLDKS